MSHKYQRFIILSTYRSGTVWLISLLNSHPMIRAFGECYHPAFFNRFSHMSVVEPWLLAHLRDCFPIFFLKHYIYKHYPSNIQAVGFKLMYTQANNWRAGQIWTWLREHRDIKIIHLKRENLLASYVSTLLTLKTNIIMTTDRKDIRKIRVIINPKDCLQYFIVVSTHRKYYDDFFKHSDMISLTYEHLVSDPNKQTTAILDFLHLPKLQLSSPLIKLNTAPLSYTIKNYNELKEYFRESEWSIFFR